MTRHLAIELPASAFVAATDLNQAMLDRAQAIGTARPVQWQQADAQQLPFADESFDVVACQFGVMFFPDKIQAFSEAATGSRSRRLLCFNVWDRIEMNELAALTTEALAGEFATDPPRFMVRTPHGYNDVAAAEPGPGIRWF